MSYEKWLDIPQYEDYQINNMGHIRRVATGRILKGGLSSNGHRVIQLSKNQVMMAFSVQSLVMSAFVGQPPEGMVIYHKNDIKSDNRLENLEYRKRFVPLGKRFKKGDDPRRRLGHKTNFNNAKLNVEQVREIRNLYASGLTQRKIGTMFSVHQGTISKIVLHKIWSQIQ